MVFLCFFFFFSSRRRHTRSYGDWSSDVCSSDLSQRQKQLRDHGTAAERTAMRLLIALGEIYEADRLIPITSAHVAGASYKMGGDPGLEFIEDFAAGARVVVPTTVNPLGMDLDRWREQKITHDFAAKQ